jgi:hypothetical protein
MTPRQILLALGMMLLVAVTATVALVLYVRSDGGASTLERLERDPSWRGIAAYGSVVPLPANRR